MNSPKVWLLIFLAVFINSFSSMIAGLCVSESVFGVTKSGAVVQRFVLEDSNGLKVCLMSMGATITEIQTPDRDGVSENVILGKDDWDTYLNGFGGSASVIGRFANRIQGAAFDVDGERFELSQNNGKNHIHGGEVAWPVLIGQGPYLMPIMIRSQLRFPIGAQMEIRVIQEI